MVGSAPSLRNAGQLATRRDQASPRYTDLETGSGSQVPIMPDTTVFATRSYDQADEREADRALLGFIRMMMIGDWLHLKLT
jgi:hypothetical protein